MSEPRKLMPHGGPTFGEVIAGTFEGGKKAIMAQYYKPPKNGFLELTEFTCTNLVADMDVIKTATREEVMDTFTAFDKDKSGFIEPDELKEALKALNMGSDDDTVQAMITFADTNNDGKVSGTEFAKIQGQGK